MSYGINESFLPPVLEGLQLLIGGVVVASAMSVPHSSLGHWRIMFGNGNFAGVYDADHAREILDWLGEKLSPLTEITGPQDLHRAAIGSVWLSEYPGKRLGSDSRNRYRLTEDGWEWTGSENNWTACKGANDDGPYKEAYPLRPVGE